MNDIKKINDFNLEKKHKVAENIIKIGGLAIVGFVVAPFIFIAIKGIIGLALAGIVGIGGIQILPLIATRFANWRLKKIKEEAARNPIETLQRDYMVRCESLKKFEDSIRLFIVKIQTFEDKLATFKTQYPGEAERFNEELNKMRQLLSLRKKKYKEAQKKLNEYEQEIQKVGAIWDMACAANDMKNAAGTTEGDFLAKIQVETAITSVQENLNMAFTDLEMLLLDESPKTTEIKILPEPVNNELISYSKIDNREKVLEIH